MGANPTTGLKVYLDEQGNPITAPGKVYLDENGNPLPAQFVQPPGQPQVSRPGAIQRFGQRIGQRIKEFGQLVGPRPFEEEPVLGKVAGLPGRIAQELVTGLVRGHAEAGNEFFQNAATASPVENVRGFLEAGVPVFGPMHRGLRKDIESGNVAGAVADSVLAAIPAGRQLRGAPRAVGQKVGILRRPEVAQSVVKEALELPPKAVLGVEDIFRGTAPTGMKVGFRESAYVAARDLEAIGRNLELKEFALGKGLKGARGGARNPDFRPRAALDGIKEHLRKMYQEERAPQIQRHANVELRLDIGKNLDAWEGLRYVQRTAGGEANRTLAELASHNAPITLAQADDLARVVNQAMAPLRNMTAAKRAQAGITNRRYGGLKELDKLLKDRLNKELTSRGEAGLTQYERRFAALSRLREQLETRINAAELERVSKPGRLARGLMQKQRGVASASQAAVADARIGDLLERGFRLLRESGLGKTPTQGGANPVIGGRITSGMKRTHKETGLPLNDDGTITLYHGTTKKGAESIRSTGQLRSAAEPDVYVTTDPSAGGYGDGTVVKVRVKPSDLILDDEFPGGRKDFRIRLRNKSYPVQLDND